MRKLSRLTERTAEIKSSDGIQLGEVEEIAGNEIIMDSHIGERARFMLPKDMISRIKRKTVYLNLTEEEFEDWWKKEGPLHAAELPGRIEVALGKKLVGEDLELLKDEVRTAFERNYPLDLPEKKREKLFLEQEEIRQSFSSKIRKMLHKDEWVHYLFDLYEGRPWYLSLDEDVFLVTSKRLIRYKSDGTEKDNWIIPLDSMKEATTRKEWRRPVPAPGPGRSRWSRRGLRREYKILRFGYRENKRLRYRELTIPLGKDYWYIPPIKSERIEDNIEKFLGLPFVKGRKFNIWIALSPIFVILLFVLAFFLLWISG